MRQTGQRGKWRGASLRQHMGRANSNGRRGRWRERPRWGILSWRCSCDAGPEGSTPCLLCTAASLVPSKEAFSQSLPTWMSQDFRSSACSTEQLCVPSYFLDGRKQDESCTEGLRQAGQSRQGQWKGRRPRGGSEVWEEKLPTGEGLPAPSLAGGGALQPGEAGLCARHRRQGDWRRPWCAGHRQSARERVRGTQAMTEKTPLLQEGGFERTDDNRTLWKKENWGQGGQFREKFRGNHDQDISKHGKPGRM